MLTVSSDPLKKGDLLPFRLQIKFYTGELFNAKDAKENAKDANELVFASFARNLAPFALNNSSDMRTTEFLIFCINTASLVMSFAFDGVPRAKVIGHDNVRPVAGIQLNAELHQDLRKPDPLVGQNEKPVIDPLLLKVV